LKRIFDIVASGLGLLILSPLFLVLAIWIKTDSRGPVFYKQTRVGRYGKDFKLFKFRSMRVGSDKKGLITVGGHDPRVTRSGYVIRKYKLDELPQLINVFIGDMSLVGPRPEVRKYVDMYTPEQLRVLDVRPGITDMASIKYSNENELLETVENPEQYYIDVVMQDKLEINLQYIPKASFIFDIWLIFKTITKVFKFSRTS
jgi:lipopolysaccharide/colanic/teichoic acid biosynthesis glycosyltransferase